MARVLARGNPETWIGWFLVIPSAAFIVLATLTPAGQSHVVTQDVFCLICGEAGIANILRNILLFVPLGMGLGLLVRSPLLAWIPALTLTVGIEVTQLWIPGRNPLVADVAANAAGGALGIAFVRTFRRSVRRSRPSLAAAAWMTLPFLVFILSGWAFQLTPPEPPHFLQLQPDLRHLALYEGRVSQAVLGERRIRPERVADPEFLEDQLFRGDTLRIEVEVAPRRWRTASLVSVYTAERKEVFLLGLAGDDVVLRLPYRATRLRLTRPDLRLTDALTELALGSQAEIRYRAAPEGLVSGGACLHIQGTVPGDAGEMESRQYAECGIGPTLGHGWGLLYSIDGLPPAVQNGVHLAWLLLLTVPAGLMASRTGTALVLAVGAAATAWASPVLLDSLATTPPMQVMMTVSGVILGHFLRRGWVVLVPPHGAPVGLRPVRRSAGSLPLR